jgi:hypothetical protein
MAAEVCIGDELEVRAALKTRSGCFIIVINSMLIVVVRRSNKLL